MKSKNWQLEKSLKTFTVKSNQVQEDIGNQLKDNNRKLIALQDSLIAKESVIKNARGTAIVALKSLKHRKRLFINGFIIGMILLAGASWFVIRKYKVDAEKYKLKFLDIKKSQEDGMGNLKNELFAQINSSKDMLEQKLNEQGKRISEQEKKINELKK